MLCAPRSIAVVALTLAGCTPGDRPAVPQAVEPLVVPEGPLPDPLTLDRVVLEMEIDPRADTFSGAVDLHVTLAEPRPGVWLHGQDLTVSLAEIDGQQATFAVKTDHGTARVSTGDTLAAGAHVLHLEWTAPLAEDLSGLFKVHERGHHFALAKSESIQARRYMPGFDEPRFKAPYSVTLTVPEGYTVVGNGAELSREAAESGFERVVLKETAPLPTYLLSLAVGQFEAVDGPPITAGDTTVPVRGFARPGQAAELGVTLKSTPPLVAILQDAFGLPWPDEKLDIVAAPAWPSGATELSAAITYREQRVLLGALDDDSVDPAARDAMLSTHAHELAHMWFGNQVTPAWWVDLWLKEGFATWASALALSTWEPDGGHDLRASGRKLRAMGLDSTAAARAIREPIQGDADIRNAYDSITYGKGMALLQMVDAGVGPDVFRPALRHWLQSNAGGTTDTADFMARISEASGDPRLGATFDSFLNQPGLPLVEVQADCPTNAKPRLTLRQKRYRPRGSAIDSHVTWTFPVCVAVDDAPVCTFVEDRVTEVVLEQGCPTTLRPNPGGHGYYRYALPTAQWTHLAKTLPSLTALEALMVVDSAAAGLAAGHVPAAEAVSVFEAAAQHKEWRVAVAPLSTVGGWWRHLDDAQRARTVAWVNQTWGDGADHPRKADQLLAFKATVLQDKAARAALSDQLKAAATGAPLSMELAGAAARVLAEDDPTGFDSVLTQVNTLDDPRLEAAVQGALGWKKVDRTAVLDQALSRSLDPRVSQAIVTHLLSTNDSALRDKSYGEVVGRLPELAAAVPRQKRRELPQMLGAGGCSKASATDLQGLFAKDDVAALAPGHERALALTVERLQLCDAARSLAQAAGDSLPR